MQKPITMDIEAKIIEYAPEHLEHTLSLVRKLRSEVPWLLPDTEVEEELRKYRDIYLYDSSYKAFVARKENNLVGYIIGGEEMRYYPEKDDVCPTGRFEIIMTFVLEQERNRGLSKKLHTSLCDYAKSRGYMG